jgi:hypothetical protein
MASDSAELSSVVVSAELDVSAAASCSAWGAVSGAAAGAQAATIKARINNTPKYLNPFMFLPFPFYRGSILCGARFIILIKSLPYT